MNIYDAFSKLVRMCYEKARTYMKQVVFRGKGELVTKDLGFLGDAKRGGK